MLLFDALSKKLKATTNNKYSPGQQHSDVPTEMTHQSDTLPMISFTSKPLRSTFLAIALTIGYSMHLTAQPSGTPSKVTIQRDGTTHRLIVNGQPFSVKGVGGESQFKRLAEMGGNAIRTWGTDRLGEILDEAQEHGLMVCAGIWLEHQRHGFSYQNAASVTKQLERSLAAVRKHKDHPALLMWGVGNEAEGESNDPSVWYAINHLGREIKKIDPNHPTMTVIAELGVNENKLKNIDRFCQDIDLVGVNSYGGIESVPERYRKSGIQKPYLITEHGPLGPWEVGKTSWGSPYERTSTEKGEFYANGYSANVLKNSDTCLGAFSFLWGNKQETTATWFGMFRPDGSRLAASDAISTAWSGASPPNQCPIIESLSVNQADQIKAGATIQATLSVSDPEDDSLQFEWVLRADSGTIGVGGDKQDGEAEFPEAITGTGTSVSVTLPESPKTFRLFAYVRDGQGGAAVANVPLRVGGMIKLTEEMKPSNLPYTVFEEADNESAYVPSGYMGNAAAIRMSTVGNDAKNGKNCLQVEYRSGDAWGGVLWQSPAEDWDGLHPGGANLTGATELEFWAKGQSGGETVNFVFGVLDGNQPYRDTAKGELKDVILTKAWTRYSIPLKGLDLRQIKTGFGWSLAGQGKAVTFFLDGVRYISEPE